MSWEIPGKVIPLEVAADYSSTGQFRFMKVDSNGRAVLCASLGEQVLGVLQNNPSALGQAGAIEVGIGVTKVYLGGTVAAGDAVTVDATGRAVTISAGQIQAGVCIVGGAVGNIGGILLTPGGVVGVSAGAGTTLILPAAADYSTTGQYLAMEIDSSGEWVRVTGDGALCNGILQNAPAAGEDAIVVIAGLATAKIGADATAAGAQVEVETTTSRMIAITQDAIPVGTLVAGGDDGEDVSMIVQIGMAGWTQA